MFSKSCNSIAKNQIVASFTAMSFTLFGCGYVVTIQICGTFYNSVAVVMNEVLAKSKSTNRRRSTIKNETKVCP